MKRQKSSKNSTPQRTLRLSALLLLVWGVLARTFHCESFFFFFSPLPKEKATFLSALNWPLGELQRVAGLSVSGGAGLLLGEELLLRAAEPTLLFLGVGSSPLPEPSPGLSQWNPEGAEAGTGTGDEKGPRMRRCERGDLKNGDLSLAARGASTCASKEREKKGKKKGNKKGMLNMEKEKGEGRREGR